MKILGHEYEIEYISGLIKRAEAVGTIVTADLDIHVDADSPVTRQQEAVLHEIIESLNYHMELKLEHNVLSSLSEGLYQVFRDNGGVPKCLKKGNH